MRYPLLILVIVIATVTLLCYLGYWQLSRGKEKQLMSLAWSQRQQAPPLPFIPSPSSVERFTPVKVSGHFLNHRNILLDNKINNGRPGYCVISPFMLADGTLILVDRGWIPLGSSRQVLPNILPLLGEVTIEGYLDFAYRNRFIDDFIEHNEIKWPLRVQQLDLNALETLFNTTDKMNKTIYPMLVKLKEPMNYCFERIPLQNKGLTAERHFGYACQWFLLALTLFSLTTISYFRHYHRGVSSE